MALFQIFRGDENELNLVPLHEGYAYFCEDTGNFFIDVSDVAGGRLPVNAYAAQILRNTMSDGSIKEIDIDDIFLRDMVAAVNQGGTGRNTLTVNALLIGNGTDAIKMVGIDVGGVVIGDAADGVKSLSGTGALFAATAGAPEFGLLPIAAGGTNASNVVDARTNLDVYSKTETDNKVSDAVSKAYNVTLLASGWTADANGGYIYDYSNTDLACGREGNVPPVITYTSNFEEYSKIQNAEATAGEGIIFTSLEKPTYDIGLTIIDIK